MAAAIRGIEIDPSTSDESRAFLALARGRAWCQAGAAERALELLAPEPIGWWGQRPHVIAGWLRWRANALDELGRHKDASEERAQLKAFAAGTGSRVCAHNDLLARLDELDLQGRPADWSLERERLLELDGVRRDALRLMAQGGSTARSDHEDVRRVLRCWRY